MTALPPTHRHTDICLRILRVALPSAITNAKALSCRPRKSIHEHTLLRRFHRPPLSLSRSCPLLPLVIGLLLNYADDNIANSACQYFFALNRKIFRGKNKASRCFILFAKTCFATTILALSQAARRRESLISASKKAPTKPLTLRRCKNYVN